VLVVAHSLALCCHATLRSDHHTQPVASHELAILHSTDMRIATASPTPPCSRTRTARWHLEGRTRGDCGSTRMTPSTPLVATVAGLRPRGRQPHGGGRSHEHRLRVSCEPAAARGCAPHRRRRGGWRVGGRRSQVEGKDALRPSRTPQDQSLIPNEGKREVPPFLVVTTFRPAPKMESASRSASRIALRSFSEAPDSLAMMSGSLLK